jgi:hypothetical protein
VAAYGRVYPNNGRERLREGFSERVRKSDDELLQNALSAVPHAPPRVYGINRTARNMADLRWVLADVGPPYGLL